MEDIYVQKAWYVHLLEIISFVSRLPRKTLKISFIIIPDLLENNKPGRNKGALMLTEAPLTCP